MPDGLTLTLLMNAHNTVCVGDMGIVGLILSYVAKESTFAYASVSNLLYMGYVPRYKLSFYHHRLFAHHPYTPTSYMCTLPFSSGIADPSSQPVA